jgi:hypothetical protein
MAEYRAEFKVEAGQASRTIKELNKGISDVTKKFVDAEIGAENFLAAASNLSQLKRS